MIDWLLCRPLSAFRCWHQPLLWTIKRIFSWCGKCFKYRAIFLIIFVVFSDAIIRYFTCLLRKALDFNLKCHLKGKKKKVMCCVKLIILLLYLWYLLCQTFWPFCVYSLWSLTLVKSIGKMSMGGTWKSPAQTYGKQCEMDYCCYIRGFIFPFCSYSSSLSSCYPILSLASKINFLHVLWRQLDEITWGS